MVNDTIASEGIRAEQELETFAIEAHMTASVTRQMDCAKAVPYLDNIAVVQQAIWNELLEAKERTPNGFHPARNAGEPSVLWVASVVRRVDTRSGYPRAGFLRDCPDVQDVIEVAMRYDYSTQGN